MKNRKTRALLDCIRNEDPDIIILLEVNQRWLEQLAPLTSQYRWKVEVPKENTYGMALYSKLPLKAEKVRFLVQKDVPSIKAAVRIKSGEEFDLYAVHPRPPVRGNLEGDIELEGSTKRDAELVRVALEISASGRPSIVAGDFNDVAWSHTTRHFQRVGQLLDPRVGRGLYNTFHAGFRWLRFPLDHLFHTKEFALVDFYRGPDVGSDHFPIYANLALTVPHDQEAPAPDKGDIKEASEKILAAHNE